MAIYFTKETEAAIVEYNKTKDERLFTEKIYPSLYQLCHNIWQTFKFQTTDDNWSNAINDVVSHCWQNLHKFDPSKGKKAFSYFGMIAKRKCLLIAQRSYKYNTKHTNMGEDDDLNELLMQQHETLPHYNDYLHTLNQIERLKNEWSNVVQWYKDNPHAINANNMAQLEKVDAYINSGAEGCKSKRCLWMNLGSTESQRSILGGSIRKLVTKWRRIRCLPLPKRNYRRRGITVADATATCTHCGKVTHFLGAGNYYRAKYARQRKQYHCMPCSRKIRHLANH